MADHIYVYGILLSPEKKLDLPPGIKGKVELITSDRLAAIIERDVSVASLQQTEEILLKAVIAHDRVIQHIFQQTSLLPARFGTGFASTDTLLEHFTANQSQYLKHLKAIAEKVEYSIKFIPLTFQADNSAKDSLKGKNYLLAKKKNYQQQQQFLNSQEHQWQIVKENLTQEFSHEILVKEKEDMNQIFLLTPKTTSPETIINSWQQQASKWQITISNPLPCYHFAPE